MSSAKKWSKNVSKITEEKELLLTFYDCHAKHWKLLRTTNLIEYTLALARARTDLTKGPGSDQASLAMLFKLVETAEERRG